MKNAKARKQNKELTIEYSLAKGDPAESERRMHRAFDILFDETMTQIVAEKTAQG